MKKQSILNDPIYGFITVPDKTVFQLIQHPYYQRLRRIEQLGLTSLVFPGAKHTRFHHALGAMHLMQSAVDTLRKKGHEISPAEAKGVMMAILLHDIGHGPFSHTLEHSIVHGVSHEDISALFMDRLNTELDGKLDLAMQIFRDEHPKAFLHQLVSSQLDMDRLDYLRRDSFFSGVFEGTINSERIITLLNVANGQLAVDAKGIYSIEHFLIARRLMYWQVYLHKTVLSAEYLLMKILQRANELAMQGVELFATPVLQFFLYNKLTKDDFLADPQVLERFAMLDDHDVMASVKVWVNHSDKVLALLCKSLVDRTIYKVLLQPEAFEPEFVADKRAKACQKYRVAPELGHYIVFTDSVRNSAYDPQSDRINILYKDGTIKDITEAADLLNIRMLSEAVEKHLLCYPSSS